MDSCDSANKKGSILSKRDSPVITTDIDLIDNNNNTINIHNDDKKIEPEEASEWTITSLFSKLEQLRTCLSLIQDNSIAIQNYLSSAVQNFFPDPKSEVSSGTTTPLLDFAKNRIPLQKAVRNLANTNALLISTASLASPVLSYHSLKCVDSNDDQKIMDSSKPKPLQTAAKSKENNLGVDGSGNPPSNNISSVSGYSEYSSVKQENDGVKTDVRLTRIENDPNKTCKEKKGCCNCFGFKKKASSTDKNNIRKTENYYGTTVTTDPVELESSMNTFVNTGETSELIAVVPVGNTTDFTLENEDEFLPILGNEDNEEQQTDDVGTPIQATVNTQFPLFQSPVVRRTRVLDRPNIPISLWSILKNCIGKDLTKMPLPVNFSEPLSMLQRLTEDFEYSDLLNTAASITDPAEQMLYVAAFTISSYATTTVRTNKPFNPLLGETYECDRSKDLGWRCINEKVVHHPPCIAQHCEGKAWTCWQQFSMVSKFHTNALSVIPLGTAHLLFTDGNHYTWRKVTTVVHSIMFGKLWVGQEGEMVITNHVNGTICRLIYHPPDGGNDSPKKITGEVLNKKGEVKYKITGLWDSMVEACEVLQISPEKLGPKRKLWTRIFPPIESEKYHNFTQLACQLNEMEEGVAPTDSRLRPDQRMMENGLWDQANNEKRRLEDKQRTLRKGFSQDSKTNTTEGVEPGYHPAWFYHTKDPLTGVSLHVYNGEYWPCKDIQDWQRCPSIF